MADKKKKKKRKCKNECKRNRVKISGENKKITKKKYIKRKYQKGDTKIEYVKMRC